MPKLFLLGNNFRGSSILGNVLNGHPEIVNLGELGRLPGFHKGETPPAEAVGCTACELLKQECPVWSPEMIRDLGKLKPSRASQRLDELYPGKWVLDATIFPFWMPAVLAGRAPEGTRAIQCVRNVVAYCYVGNLMSGRPFIDIAMEWCANARDVANITASEKVPCLVVRYDDFARNPERMLESICDFLGISFDKQMLATQQVALHALGGHPAAFATGAEPKGNRSKQKSPEPLRPWVDLDWISQMSAVDVAQILKHPVVREVMASLDMDPEQELGLFVEGNQAQFAFNRLEVMPASDPEEMAAQDRFQRIFMIGAYRQSRKSEDQVARFIQRCEIPQNELTVDFGCGAGHACRYMADHGYWNLGIDVAANCLASHNVGRFPFLRACVWSLQYPISASYGFASNLLQTIPADRIDDTLRMIAAVVQKETFFDISVRPDQFGKRIGERLHQTVRPQAWWLDMLGKYFLNVTVLSVDSVDQSFEVVVSNLPVPIEEFPDEGADDEAERDETLEEGGDSEEANEDEESEESDKAPLKTPVAAFNVGNFRWTLAFLVVMFAQWIFALNYDRLAPFDTPCLTTDGVALDCAAPQEASSLEHIRRMMRGTTRVGVAESYSPPLYFETASVFGRLMSLRKGADLSLDIRLRSVGVIFGVLAVVGVFALAMALQDSKPLAVLAAAIAGLTPMFCYASATLGENSMAACLCVWSAVFLVNGKRLRPIVIAGVLAGLAYETSPIASALLVLWVCYLAFRPEYRKERLVGFAASLAIGAYFWIHSLHVVGNPLGFTPTGEAPLSVGESLMLFLKSAVGVFGDRSIFLSNYVYAPVLLLLGGGLVMGVIAHVKLKDPRWNDGRFFIAFGLATVVLFIIQGRPEAIGLSSAFCVVGLVTARGWASILSEQQLGRLVVASLVGFLLLNVYANHLLPGRFAVNIDDYNRAHPKLTSRVPAVPGIQRNFPEHRGVGPEVSMKQRGVAKPV